MRPLRDSSADQRSDEGFAAGLMRANRGYQPAAGAKERVRSRLDTTRATVPASMRLVSAAVLGVVLSAAALAMFGRAKESRPVQSPLPATRGTDHPRLAPAPSVVVVPLEKPADTSRERPRHRLQKPIVARQPPAADDRESALVLEAIERWRVNGDAARAGELVDEYLQRFPNGSLVEEAYAVAMEAAGKGSARARTLAVRYLQRFPQGRFSEQAQRTTDFPQK
jgi:hypothetical protein